MDRDGTGYEFGVKYAFYGKVLRQSGGSRSKVTPVLQMKALEMFSENLSSSHMYLLTFSSELRELAMQ